MGRRLVAIGLVAAGAAVGWAVRADPPRAADSRPEYFARYVEHGAVQPGLNDLAPVLHIDQYQGRVKLTSGFRSCKLALTAYKDGKPAELPDAEADLGAVAETSSTLQYAVQVVDLDYLPLGGAKKGHCRLRFTLRHPDGATDALERDIPKALIDLSKCSNLGFSERAATGTEVPLFWLKAGGVIPGPDDMTREDVVAKGAKDGAVLIVSLRFNEADKVKAGK
jgi:hypothetical protein